MNTHPTSIDLQPGQALTLPQTGDHWLLVLQGRIWLTRSRDLDDHFLQAGERMRLGDQGPVVVEADGRQRARCVLQEVGVRQEGGVLQHGALPRRAGEETASTG